MFFNSYANPPMSEMYGQFYTQAQQMQQQQNQVQNRGITWVQGEAGAKGFQLPPNSNAILLDSEDSVFYIKTTDNVGMATLRKFKFEEVTSNVSRSTVNQGSEAFVTRQEFESLKQDISKYCVMKGVENNESNLVNGQQ